MSFNDMTVGKEKCLRNGDDKLNQEEDATVASERQRNDRRVLVCSSFDLDRI